VGAEAAHALKTFLGSKTGIDCHLADQIALYAALAKGYSTFKVEAITSHLLTNIWVIEQFLDVKFDIQGRLHEKGSISLEGAGYCEL
jgi:RNA 3'-terminal phosphate cyclase (ATP)